MAVRVIPFKEEEVTMLRACVDVAFAEAERGVSSLDGMGYVETYTILASLRKRLAPVPKEQK